MNSKRLAGLLALHALLINGMVDAQQPGDLLEAYLPGGALMQFRWIPPGTATIGTTHQQEEALRASGLSRGGMVIEQPAHTYTTDTGFYLGAHEVTQAQWLAVMRSAPWVLYASYVPDAPAICVSWEMANDFIDRLNLAMGDSLYRLPSEEEWEYAARAGTGTVWFFGDDPDSLVMYDWVYQNSMGTGRREPHAVGQKRPNPWGLHDMYGNVREWCADRPAPYVPDGFVGPVQLTGGDVVATRGGSRDSGPRTARSAARGAANPSNAYNILQGFRIVRARQ